MTTLSFSRFHPPRPLETAALEAFLVRLASDQTQAPVVFEVRSRRHRKSEASEISYWLGARPEHLRWLRRTCRDLLPGILLDGSQDARPPVTTAAQLVVTPASLALSTDRPESVSRAILSSLHQALTSGEQLVLQIVLGPRRTPAHRQARLHDPAQPWWSAMLNGVREASPAAQRQADQRSQQAGMATCIRLGVSANDSRRRRRLLIGLLGGISTAKSPGTFMQLRREEAVRLDRGAPPTRWRSAPSAAELVGLLGWPLGDGDMPGLPPMHPKLLPVPRALVNDRTAARTFGRGSAPGAPVPVGIAAKDSLHHLVAVGPTGSGKSTALLHLIRADIEAGRSVLVVDPKRQLVDDIVERAVPEGRVDDIVILDASRERTPGFNPLDVGRRDPDVVVDGLLAVFSAVFADGWGPRTQDVMHSTLLTLARSNSRRRGDGSAPFTLLDVPRLLTDARFRRSVAGLVAKDPALGSFWSWYEAQSPKAAAAAIAPVSNKLRQYLLRPAMRRVLGQPRPRFRLRDVFTANKVVLVPLNEAHIGPMTAQLLGGLIVAEAWMATLERASESRPMDRPASVWIDEVQNYLHLPTSLDAALNASRSMGVGWHMAHQFRQQLPAAMLAAVDSNARNKIIFRPHDPKDAVAFARQAPGLSDRDFSSLGQYEAYASLVSDGAAQDWCSVTTLAPPEPTRRGHLVRAASDRNYAAAPEVPVDAEPVLDVPIGRKPRGPRP